ncbi:alpha/beta hydrolase [Bailinhaonella thermotolerans]|nr:alpha/beta hydrolase [Bailinhaonella thermotolerans]
MDPQTRAIIDVISDFFPKVGTEVLDAAEARRMLAETPALGEPPPVGSVEDRVIDAAGADLPVRIYRPRGGREPYPVVVYFHGGGMVLGGLDSHAGVCRQLAEGSGAIVIAVDYRLAPEHPYPIPQEDAYAATAWAHRHAAGLGGDPERLAVAGDSAGANLAACVCLAARDRGGPPLRFQLLVYPMLDPAQDTPSYGENAEGYFLTAAHMRWYWDNYLGGKPYDSPLDANLAGLPPALVMTAEHDPLRDEGETYAVRLREAGVSVTATRYDGLFHGFFGMGAILPAARRATDEACAALRAALSASADTADTAAAASGPAGAGAIDAADAGTAGAAAGAGAADAAGADAAG